MSVFDQNFVDALALSLAPRVAELVKDHLKSPKVAPRWVNFEQAAVMLSTTKDGVRGMARAKRFPVHKMGARVLIDVKDIEKALAENTGWLT